ncbi:MAG: tRNA (adenosine(37)-N6)-threonylcarbamoyltransferase complex transferase subunit TsaD [Oscillospiraceae bacterium]|jgi:N6-L-threonylcarbamoyladenine synthase|nr:tRNA (adenosine(37)-N6)-threonylcarbamoyltransferase complex transferase subunit TsaD [Oscillospiraceae bacterium]
MKILGIETSCDETACAVVENGRKTLSTVIASQVDEHRLYGGVVPEIASRRHSECIAQVCEEALKKANCKLDEVDGVAVTFAPGLIGALLVGVNFAKGLALAANKPLIPVHHIKGHAAANYLAYPELEPPYLCLAVSGGHSQIMEVKSYTDFSLLGRTIDDAAGEAFDKVARSLGFPYPGGIYIDEVAKNGDKNKYSLPYPKTQNELDFSFSGLKTAVINLIHNTEQRGQKLPSMETLDKSALAASFQHTVCDILCTKLVKAAELTGHKKIALTGGVAANSGLRDMIAGRAEKIGAEIFIPPLPLCGDNAAMIAAQGFYEFLAGNTADMSLNARANGDL